MLRIEQTAFDNLQKLSDAHEAMREQWQQAVSEKNALQLEINQLKQRLNETEQTVSQMEEKIAAWKSRQNVTVSSLAEIQNSLKQINRSALLAPELTQAP